MTTVWILDKGRVIGKSQEDANENSIPDGMTTTVPRQDLLGWAVADTQQSQGKVRTGKLPQQEETRTRKSDKSSFQHLAGCLDPKVPATAACRVSTLKH